MCIGLDSQSLGSKVIFKDIFVLYTTTYLAELCKNTLCKFTVCKSRLISAGVSEAPLEIYFPKKISIHIFTK